VPDPGLCPGRDCVGLGAGPLPSRGDASYWARRRVKAASGVTAWWAAPSLDPVPGPV